MNKLRVLAGLLLVPFLTSCASAPAQKPAGAPDGPSPQRVSLICHERSLALSFDQLGIPKEEFPIGVAIHGENTYVLFRPGRLLRITLRDGKARTEMALAPIGVDWTSLAVDPTDGSVWVTSNFFELLRVDRDWQMQKIPIKRVVGEGGFVTLLAARDALYAKPFCAEDGIWRIDRTGTILGTAFPVPPRPEAEADQPMHADELRCASVRLERDPEGRIVVWDSQARALHQVDDQGTWSEVAPSFFAALPASGASATVVRGIDVGGADEQWMLRSRFGAGGLFYWKGRPVFFGGIGMRNTGGHDTLLLVPRPDGSGLEELVESCYKLPILDVATDGTRYAAITDLMVVFGDLASAPDLPNLP